MDDGAFGTRDKRGDRRPAAAIQTAPVFVFPPQPLKFLRWLPGYLLPWNGLFFAVAAVFWFWLTPPTQTLQTLSPGWIAYLLVRNSALVLAFYGALELRLYVKRRQGARFKYNGKWPSEQQSNVFWFKNQNVDNALRTFVSGVPIWTA